MAKNRTNIYYDFTTWILILLILALIGFIIYYAVRISKNNKNNIDKEDFADSPTIRIIYLYSYTCPFCQQFESTFDVTSRKFAQKMKKNNVDIKKYEKANIPASLQDYIEGFPTVLLFKDDSFLEKSVGKMSEEQFMNFLQTHV